MSENLQEATAAAVAEPAAKEVAKTTKKRGIACIVLRDYWGVDGDRVPAGTEVTLDAEEAMDGVEAGTLSRVKEAK